jgi:hypothetical protein
VSDLEADYEFNQTNAWLQRTRWAQLFENRPHILIGRTKILPYKASDKVQAWESHHHDYPLISPVEDEMRLHQVILAIDRLFLRLFETFDHTEHIFKVWLNSYSYFTNSASHTRPVRGLDRPSTQRQYLNHLKQLICYVMRISRFPEEVRRKIYTFTLSRKEEYALRQIWLYLETVYPNINATGSATLSDLNDGYEPEAEVESPGTPDINDEDFNDQNYLEDDEMDETETAAADLLDVLPESIDSGDGSEDDDPNPHVYEADAVHSISDTAVSSD